MSYDISQKRSAILQQDLPLVTIAIPTYNRAELLIKAIDSALGQTYPKIEVVVSDNASRDDTAARLSEKHHPRLRYERQPSNIGSLGNWNACLALAHGEYFIMLSDDDSLTPTAIDELIAPFLATAPDTYSTGPDEIAFSYGYCDIYRSLEARSQISLSAPHTETSDSYRTGILNMRRLNYPSATLFRTEDAKSIGGYERQDRAFDLELTFRLSAKRRIVACTRTVTAHYFFHSTNLTLSLSIESLMSHSKSLAALANEFSTSTGNSRAIREARAAGIRNQILTLDNYVLTIALSSGAIKPWGAINEIWKHRALFANPTGAWMLPRTVIKFLLAATVGSPQH
jgi:hypothetical protein